MVANARVAVAQDDASWMDCWEPFRGEMLNNLASKLASKPRFGFWIQLGISDDSISFFLCEGLEHNNTRNVQKVCSRTAWRIIILASSIISFS
jgi:hypothetical protein